VAPTTGPVRASLCLRIPVVVKASEMAEEMRRGAIEVAADLALDGNTTLVLLGQKADDDIVLCADQCALFQPGAIVVVPDVDVVQMGRVPEGSMRVEREADLRVAYVFDGVGAETTR
jgi:hypothetical protein